MKCNRCGMVSDVEQAFSLEKHWIVRTRRFCPDCTVKRQAQSFLIDVGLIVAASIAMFMLNPYSRVSRILLDANMLILFSIPLIIIHELAHAGVAHALGLRVFGIAIGVGRTILSGKFLGLDWIVNLIPIGGITSVAARPMPGLRWKLFLVYLAGPLSHIVLALFFFAIALLTPSSFWIHRMSNLLVVANLLIAAANLYPRKVSITTGMQGTDGWNLLRVLKLSDAELTQRYIGYYAAEALQAYHNNDFEKAHEWIEQALHIDERSTLARNVLGILQMARGEHQAARETFLQLLEADPEKQLGTRYILLNNVAYLDALMRDPALMPEADQYSTEALKHLPWVSAVVGTRGTVLVEMGQLEEGIALLKKSMSLHPDRQGKALNACHLAIAEFRRGHLEQAHKYMATARTLDPRCILLHEVERELDTPLTSRELPLSHQSA